MSDAINNSLDLAPITKANTDVVVYEESATDQAGQDIDTARDGLHDALSMSQQAVQDMITISQQSQHPKAYEVLNQAIKTMADISMGIADLQLKKQRIYKQLESDREPSTTVNNLFVGSTAELQQMIEDMMNDRNG